MKKAKVFFAPVADAESLESQAEKAVQLAEAAQFEKLIQKGRPCALKTHFGEGQGIGYIRPPICAAVAEWARRAGGLPFLTDTNTLYRGHRSNAVDHAMQAAEHGFTFEVVHAPVIIADGLHGADQVTVPITGGRRFKEVRIASALHQAPSAVVLTHVKGHLAMGFGGSIKNVGMGCAARAGKLAQHQGGHPKFDEKKCKSCGTCVRWCPTDALALRGKLERVALDPEKCIGCGECLALCPFDAIGFDWSVLAPELTEKVCEHVLGFLANKAGRVGYLNFITHVTKNCDCMGNRQKAERPNIGIVASTDIVAADKAAADLTKERYGEDVWAQWWPESEYERQFEYGEKLGIGTRDYELKEI
jgi:uncharacterized Fe-S center protein